MAVDNEVNGNTEGPFEQFEICTYDTNCKFKDVNGRCIFEICIIQHTVPPLTLLWYFECVICKTVDCIRPNDMKMHVCSSCISRMHAAEALPINCRWCGRKITKPPSWMFSGLCPVCLDRLYQAAWVEDFNDTR
jgi:hypothetical protein